MSHGRSTVAGKNMHTNCFKGLWGAAEKVSKHHQPVTSKLSVRSAVRQPWKPVEGCNLWCTSHLTASCFWHTSGPALRRSTRALVLSWRLLLSLLIGRRNVSSYCFSKVTATNVSKGPSTTWVTFWLVGTGVLFDWMLNKQYISAWNPES